MDENNNETELIFEWDDLKNEINIKKHGIDFIQAINVFNDPFRYDRQDKRHSLFENRRKVIGLVDKVIFVVYTIRGKCFRIISARLATNKEKIIYEYNKNKGY